MRAPSLFLSAAIVSACVIEDPDWVKVYECTNGDIQRTRFQDLDPGGGSCVPVPASCPDLESRCDVDDACVADVCGGPTPSYSVECFDIDGETFFFFECDVNISTF